MPQVPFEDITWDDDDFSISLGDESPANISSPSDMEQFLVNLLQFSQECSSNIEEIKSYSELESLKHHGADYRGVRIKVNGQTFYLTII